MSNKNNFRVVDEEGNIHICTYANSLGKGGQGIVLRTLHDKNTAVKLVIKQKSEKEDDIVYDSSPGMIGKIKSDIHRLRLYPLKSGLHLTMPLAALADHAGYVMQLLEGIEPLTSLMISCNNNVIDQMPLPAWMNINPAELGEGKLPEFQQLAFYLGSGGLGRRVRILRDLAVELGQLHVNNLVFCDLSHRNVMIMPDGLREECAVWLIDVDNIRHEGEEASVSTPHYRAPELLEAGTVALCASDVYSFALLAFELLTMEHPFNGQLAANNDGEIPESDAPWIFDKDDRSNRAPSSVAAKVMLTLSPALFALFDAVFGEGRKNYRRRPSLAFWRKALEALLDQIVRCPSCGNEWPFPNSPEVCPFCEKPLRKVLILTYGEKLLFAKSVEGSSTVELPLRLFSPGPDLADKTALSVTRNKAGEFALHFSPGLAFSNENGDLKNCVLSADELSEGIELKLRASAAWSVRLSLV